MDYNRESNVGRPCESGACGLLRSVIRTAENLESRGLDQGTMTRDTG